MDDAVTTKERLLTVALEILATDGVSGMTIRNIAERGGVSVSVVHHHYVNKQGLLDACKTHFYSGIGAVVAELITKIEGASTEVLIEECVRGLWRYARDNMAVLRLLASDVFAEGQLIQPYRSYEERPFFSLATAMLAPRLNLPNEVSRARVQAMAVVVTRFAVSSDAELMSVFGVEAEAAVAAAEENLVEMALLLLSAR